MRAFHRSSVASLGNWRALSNLSTGQQHLMLFRTCCPSPVVAVSASTSCSHPFVEHSYIALSEAHTQHVAAELAASREPGDVYCLHGDVGAGKSAFRYGKHAGLSDHQCMQIFTSMLSETL